LFSTHEKQLLSLNVWDAKEGCAWWFGACSEKIEWVNLSFLMVLQGFATT
jgi:hypothetical protein